MPITQKSNIRSRWYRPNEKPLESNTTSKVDAEPFGEISHSQGTILTDDLSSAKPPTSNNQENKRTRPEKRRNERRGRKTGGQENAKHNDGKGHQTNREQKKEGTDSPTKKHRPSKHRNNFKNKRGDHTEKKDHSKRKGQPKSLKRKSYEKSKKIQKSKLSTFISKIFGG